MPFYSSFLLIVSVMLLAACGGSSGADRPDPGTPPPNGGPINPGDPGEPETGLSVSSIGDSSITVSWSAVEQAETYRLYYAAEPIQNIDNIASHNQGDWLDNVTSPYTLTELTNGITYYLIVTAVDAEDESILGAQVSATPMTEIAGPQPTAQEVRMIELINRARRDPTAEVARNPDIDDLNQGLDPGTLNANPKQPLAFNTWLMIAARDHSDWMLDTNTFSHTGENGSTPYQRATIAGYSSANSVGENISVSGRTNLNPTQAIDSQHTGLFTSPGHRRNILSDSFREIGVGQEIGSYDFESMTLPSSMITQKYGRRGNAFFITGVVYQDNNNNGIYDVGEGMDNIVITVNGSAHSIYESGIYAIPVAGNTTYQLTFAGGALPEPWQAEINVSNRNVKVDVIVTDDILQIDSW